MPVSLEWCSFLQHHVDDQNIKMQLTLATIVGRQLGVFSCEISQLSHAGNFQQQTKLLLNETGPMASIVLSSAAQGKWINHEVGISSALDSSCRFVNPASDTQAWQLHSAIFPGKLIERPSGGFERISRESTGVLGSTSLVQPPDDSFILPCTPVVRKKKDPLQCLFDIGACCGGLLRVTKYDKAKAPQPTQRIASVFTKDRPYDAVELRVQTDTGEVLSVVDVQSSYTGSAVKALVMNQLNRNVRLTRLVTPDGLIFGNLQTVDQLGLQNGDVLLATIATGNHNMLQHSIQDDVCSRLMALIITSIMPSDSVEMPETSAYLRWHVDGVYSYSEKFQFIKGEETSLSFASFLVIKKGGRDLNLTLVKSDPDVRLAVGFLNVDDFFSGNGELVEQQVYLLSSHRHVASVNIRTVCQPRWDTEGLANSGDRSIFVDSATDPQACQLKDQFEFVWSDIHRI